MIICVPTIDDRGLEGTPSDHFGSAPFFTFVDTETGDQSSIQNGGASHVHGSCRPLEFLGARPVDAVACRGVGRGAVARLLQGGIQVFKTLETDVGQTIEAYKEGRLLPITSEGACQGHGGGHGHGGHGHGGHGHGRQSGCPGHG